ncbi:class A beta-lactamase [Amycolatopsis magusensis]|uniref:class A beta-lactamase n=1 Tax=Amycolatopsis magusensis TaxID=882444 RepID=UPI0024A7E8A4|nr:class A beta-lactamase [Amycolatopsis magusensis]MDI5976678.1 class A beta-lactamase [Amycolatopsis magusensis]
MLSIPKRHAWLIAAAFTLGACAPAAPEPAPPTPSAAAPSVAPGPAATPPDPAVEQEFTRLQTQYDARLGLYAVDTGSGESVAFRADERFAFASTFKALAAAAVLDSTTPQQLDQVVRYSKDELLENSPITKDHVATGMTLRELCDAAVRFSDNTAGNLLLKHVGGPQGLDAALTAVGDEVTSADRWEPELNSAVPGDVRDTSTPRALAHDLRQFVLGDALAEDDRALLTDWLRRNTTGGTVIRAGVPADWVVGDKTGSGYYGGRNDIAVLWPPNRAPIVMAVMTSREEPRAKRADALLADAARVAVTALG